MNKLLFLPVILVSFEIVLGQSLEKGNLVGFHLLDLNLRPDVTYNQFKDFYLNTWAPKIDDAYQGDAKVFLVECIRGENENEVGLIYVFKSESARDKYFNDDGTFNDYGRGRFDNMFEMIPEMEKYVISWPSKNTKHTDWIVQ